MLRKEIQYVIIIAAVAVSATAFGLNQQQIAATAIFSSLITGTLLFWRFRLAFAFVGLGALLGTGLLDVETLIEFAGLDIILFLIGMMTVIGYLEERRFFEKLVDRIIGVVGDDPKKLVLVLMLMSAFFAALVDEVTSILFMTATVLHLTSKRGVNPVPFVMMIIFATNIGSSATVVGNPVGVLIALRGGLSFQDFLRWATPISIVSLLVTIPLSFIYYSKDIRILGERIKEGTNATTAVIAADDHPEEQTPNNQSMRTSWLLFIGTIVSLVLHTQVEQLLHLHKNSMLIGTAIIAAGIALFLERNRARELIERRVDWWTLSFFLILFASVATLSFTGVTRVLSQTLFTVSGGNETFAFLLLTIIAGGLSALLDNVLAVATLLPVVQDFGTLGINNFPLYWGLLFGGTLFGNLTMIGSTANIVAIGMLERRKVGHITLMQWIKPGAIISLSTLTLAIILVFLQIPFMPSRN